MRCALAHENLAPCVAMESVLKLNVGQAVTHTLRTVSRLRQAPT